jgi:hypothetical protein
MFCMSPVRARLRLVLVVAEAAGEAVAAALGDRLHDAATEAAVLGRDARGEYLHLLDRVFDEEVVGGAKEVVGHVHTVDQELVVIGEAAGNRDLAGIRRVVGQPRGQFGDALNGAR